MFERSSPTPEQHTGELQRDALRHLMEYGPTTFKSLYLRFGPARAAELVLAFQELIEWRYVEIGSPDLVGITGLGIEQVRRVEDQKCEPTPAPQRRNLQ
jgi:hypothetical protein